MSGELEEQVFAAEGGHELYAHREPGFALADGERIAGWPVMLNCQVNGPSGLKAVARSLELPVVSAPIGGGSAPRVG